MTAADFQGIAPTPWRLDRYGHPVDANGDAITVCSVSSPSGYVPTDHPGYKHRDLLLAAPALLAENERLRARVATLEEEAVLRHEAQVEETSERARLADSLENIKATANRALHGDKAAYFASLQLIRDQADAAGRLPEGGDRG